MKGSTVISRANKYGTTNMSNEFVDAKLDDNVAYNVRLKDLSEMNNDLTEKFLSKQRVVKEKTSIGGFRIPQQNLKKRVNPSESMKFYSSEKEYIDNNPALSNFSANAYARTGLPRSTKNNNTILTSAEPMVDENMIEDDINGDQPLSGKLLDSIHKQVEYLKRQSEEYSRQREMTSQSKAENQIDEEKVRTEYLSYNPDRVQAIKHVTTNFKPEYISLEELQRHKEEHQKKLLEIENAFYESKRQLNGSVDRYSKLSGNNYYDAQNFEDEPKISKDELDAIIRHENEFLQREKKDRKFFKQRAKSVKGIRRVGIKESNMPLDKDEERYLKKYLNFKMKKQHTSSGDQLEEWNTTKIKSQNTNGVVNRKDKLPGHIDREDYSLYYMSIDSSTPRSLSLKSVKPRSRSCSFSADKAKTTRNKMSKSTKVAKEKASTRKMNSHLAFIKLIFNMLDKEKTGLVTKEAIINEMRLDLEILSDLGLENKEELEKYLHEFRTANEGAMTEQEFEGFLLSRSQLAEEYLNNFMNAERPAEVSSEPEENLVKQEESEPEEEHPGLSNNMDFLKYPSTEERLDRLKESYSISSKSRPKSKDFNVSLERNLKDKIIAKPQTNVTYKEYQQFLDNYQNKSDLNFTVPKPFDFLKRDYGVKKAQKIQEILEERKRKEDEILDYRFKPNELKREIFISQFENIIQGEKEKRKYRTEKLKEKIVQEMKPFSFYEQDERKFKEKLQKQCEAPQFAPFKANPVPWTSQVNMMDDILKKMDQDRNARIQERAMETYKAAKLPPRMDMHDKKKQMQEKELKMLENTQSTKRSKSIRANKVPNFSKLHEDFTNTLEKKKKIKKKKLQEPVPFNFHEPKKKASLRTYLDKENDPQAKNPQFKRNIVEIIQKIQQKPKIEPASTKGLNLLMATRRKELEEKQRKEEERLLEDKFRKEKQQRLKERVVGSKALVDNTKSLEEKRKRQQDQFKRNLQEQKNEYQQELARRLQRVYNKPLMLESVSNKTDKFVMNKNMQANINEIQNMDEEELEIGKEPEEGQDQKDSNQKSPEQKEDESEIYEEKFEDIE